MKDFVPLGTGNSRFLKSVANFLTLYPDYASFAAALVAGTLPVDFNGINTAGVAQSGTPLFISIGEECFTEEVQKDIKAAFELMCSGEVGIEPLDWQKTKTPSLWKTKTGKIINYEW